MSFDAPPLPRMLELAQRAALAPSKMILAAFRDPALSFELKPDHSPVTPFDLEAERQIREVLATDPEHRYPVLGEELGGETEGARYRWVVDPIDGTLPFTRGLPYFGTLVALEEARIARSLVGVLQLPAFGETYTAARGAGACCNGRPIQVSARRELGDCIVSAQEIGKFELAGLLSGYQRLASAGPYFRGAGDCWMHAMAARGAVDVVIEFTLNRWDIAATEVIVEEAGGRYLTRTSKINPAKFDLICGSPAAVDDVARLLDFLA